MLDLEHEILQVRVHTRLRVDRILLICKKVVELHNTDRNGLEFLSAEECISQVGVFQHLVGDDGRNMSSFCDIPPVITIERGIQVVTETLHTRSSKGDVLTSRIWLIFCSYRNASSRLMVTLGLAEGVCIVFWYIFTWAATVPY